MRAALPLLPMLLLLGGCSNQVFSETPWFAKEAEADAPRLRAGLWVATRPSIRGKECRFDDRRPSETWPDCASYYIVREGEVLSLGWLETTQHSRSVRTYDWNSVAHVLAAGEPRIDQAASCRGRLAPLPVPDDGLQAPADPRRYCYEAIRPTKIVAGEIVAVETWPVVCGPWPTQEQSDRAGGKVVTASPFSGLHIVNDNCTAESVDALREAAKASEAIAIKMHFGPQEAHWVRDDYH